MRPTLRGVVCALLLSAAGCGDWQEPVAEIGEKSEALRGAPDGGEDAAQARRLRVQTGFSAAALEARIRAAAAKRVRPEAQHAGTSRVVALVPRAWQRARAATFSVAIVGRGFDLASEGGGIELKYDPAVARVVDVKVDDSTWEFFAQNGSVDAAMGQVHDILFASFKGHKGDFPIATLTFESVGRGGRDLGLQLAEAQRSPFASGGAHLAVRFEQRTQ